ncbi:MAG TPA: glycosyl hydrolase family 28-related protein, partial [Armatimonadota bacterium]|nr:glycosyl hydrolase family 28-related protein [Armatimonadota bacterium]
MRAAFRCCIRLALASALPALAMSTLAPGAAAPSPRASQPSRSRAALAAPAAPQASTRQIPALKWEVRSDWINVKTDVSPAAVGDGKADDTEAIQKALDRVAAATNEASPAADRRVTLYFPPGAYRITHTLSFTGPVVGALLVGCGRDTRLVWDGETGGKMLHLNGISYSIFMGMELDGRGKAAVGFWYKSNKRFQTEVTHRHLAFRNFTDAGLLNDPTRDQALAETT